MSRKARSKKGGGDANIPNFVFNPSNVDFNFSGSSASTSPTSTTSSQQPFTFGSPTMNPLGGVASANTGAFTFKSPSSTGSNPTFGSAPASGGMSSEFTFSAPSSPLKRTVSDLALPGPSLVDPLRRTASEVSPSFAFGTPASPAGSSPAGGFTFGSTAPTVTGQASPSIPGGFSFGTTTSASSSSIDTTKGPTITFGSTVATGTTTSSSIASDSTSDSTSKPAFMFGSPTINTSSAAKPGFTFGSPNASAHTTSTDTAPKPGFSFGAPTTSNTGTTQSSAFSATPSSTTPKPTVPTNGSNSTFSFGSPASTSTATITPTTTAAPVPSFGAGLPGAKDTKESPAISTTSGDSTAKATPSTPSFSFGSPKTGSTTAATSAPPSPAPTMASFSFGKSADTSSSPISATSTPKLSFSAPEKKDTTATAMSTISATSVSIPASSTFSSATPAAAPKPNTFSFSKVLEDLERIASQPPSQIQASLLTPALQGLQQNQIVTMTNFRIDNILPTTRFSELPEQAQMELDQLNQYIRGETQRCDFILKHGARQHVNTIENTRTQTDFLIQQLGALSSSLKRKMQNIEHLFDKAGAQLRHAADASSVIEACKHRGSASRWLSGYGTDDDYFANLSNQLQARLEEYKRTVWEIERTADSWSKHKIRTPQDIGRIMKEQNSAFLALANRVALLDETVKGEKERHAHYVKMYS